MLLLFSCLYDIYTHQVDSGEFPLYLQNEFKYHCDPEAPPDKGQQTMSTHTAHFVASNAYSPMLHVLSPGDNTYMWATKCAANVGTFFHPR